ncbi:hypothetical protein QJS10_CPA02g00136 [Acorus calamus]|uniref:Bromodomain associated domain-containing protein n=1 Tax=Acorus calamus TaxID=4465 RepID=A0AAV9FE84_ACOCL|nr:hypothetical protein QJS10_CPA02g00136 [Acorus calamus]
MAELMLGEDGRGYDLARRLEGCGAWRSWLGDSAYTAFAHYLSSPSAWDAFLSSSSSASPPLLRLQIRARALLFDKAAASLFLRPTSSAASLNPAYLQLHEDDVYFVLDEDLGDGLVQHQDAIKIHSRASFSKMNERASGVGSRYSESDKEHMSQRPWNDELSESWYDQCREKHRLLRQCRSPSRDKDLHKRTPEGMSSYIKILERHKRRRKAFIEDPYVGSANSIRENGSRVHPNSVSDVNNLVEGDIPFFPEMMFPSNCVPESSLPPPDELEDNKKVEVYGILDNLPLVTAPSPAMIERFGIKPDYLRMGLGRTKNRGKDGNDGSTNPLSENQASLMAQKVVARMLAGVGIEGATEVTLEALSKFLSCHVCKLGRNLKLLTDNYRKQHSSLELLKMFLQTAGLGNLGALAEHLKGGNRVLSPQIQQHEIRAIRSQQQNSLLHSQMQREIQSALQHQQWEKQRQRQTSIPRSMAMDKTMVEVKMENVMDPPPTDTMLTAFAKQQLQQLRQQQMAMANHHAQSSHQFKQISSHQIPQLQQQASFSVRTPPVKVEGFEQLMGGDSTSKHDSDEHRLTSPPK